MGPFCRRQAGFSLLEVLITLVIVSVAGGLILTRMQAITDYHLRMQGHLADINGLQNQIALFPLRKAAEDEVRLVSDHLAIFQPGQSEPIVRVDNFSTTPYQVPVTLGYSPYQLYRWSSQKGRELGLIMPGLLPKNR